MLKISVMSIGDELCIGQVTNSNAAWIAMECTKLGAKIERHSTVGDEKEMIVSELESLMSVSDLVITTGGLGPTHDDISKEVLCEFFDDKLVLNNEVYEYLKELYKRRGFQFSERNQSMAWLPSKCKILRNEVGSASGMLFEKDGKYVISLPGVPAEMKNIMTTGVIPFVKELIRDRKSDVMLFKTFQTAGIPESMLADLIGEPSQFLKAGETLAFLPSYRGVRLRLGVEAPDMLKAQKRISELEEFLKSKAGDYVYGYGDESLSSAIGKMLIDKKKTVAVAESCTGGMLGAAFTDNPGSSEYFFGGIIAYSNDVKISQVNVKPETIDNFGAVSEETAVELAVNIRKIFNTDFGIGVTGIAGPTGGSPEKPVGTVWIALADKTSVKARKFVFGNDRAVNREIAVGRALTMLYEKLHKL